MCYTKGLPLVHAQSAGSLAITITFWTILLSIAGLAVNFIVMDCDSCAVQALPTYHAQEAGLVEAPPITQYLFCKVHCLLAAATLVSSSQWHPDVCR